MSFQTISSINYALSCQLSSVAEWSGQCTGLAQVSVRFLLEDLRTFSVWILLATGCCGFYNRRGGGGGLESGLKKLKNTNCNSSKKAFCSPPNE